jgi:hypothetical protein
MMISNSLLKISGKRIKLLAEAINTARPGLYIDAQELNKMSAEARQRKLATLFAMHGFTEEELREIKSHVNKIKIPYRFIAACLVVAGIAFISYKVYQFVELPRVYAIGNDVAVSTTIDSSGRVVKRLDLFGKSNAGKSTGYSMILIRDTGSHYVVQNNDFLSWFMGTPQNYYVSKAVVVLKKKDYLEFERIFEQAKGLADLDQLTAADRIAIKACIDNNNDLFKAVVEVNKDSTGAYKSFIAANGINEERYIFLCLKKQNDQPFNVQVISQRNLFARYKEISSVGKSFDAPLQWKLYQGSNFPIIYFSNLTTKETYQSLTPPYDTFLKSST